MRASALITALALIASPAAHAGGFLVSKIGGDGAGPAAPTPAAVFWNPATLGLIDGTTLWVDANLIYRAASYTRIDGDTYGGQSTLGGLDIQPALAAATDFGRDDLTVALGVYAPFGSGSEWDDPSGPQRHHAIWGSIRGIYVTPAVAWRPIEGLHLGASLSYVNAAVRSYRALDLGVEIADRTGADVPPEEPGNEGRAHLDFAGHAFSYALGVTWQHAAWTLGASYTGAVELDLPGYLDVYVPRNDFYQGLTGGDVAEAARFRATWPAVVRAGLTYAATERTTLSLSTEWAMWSSYDQVVIDVEAPETPGLGNLDQTRQMDYRDTVNVRLGIRHQLTDTWALFGGLGGENGAIPEERLDPSLYDAPKFGGALGVAWKITDRFTYTTSYNHLVYLPTRVQRTDVEPAPTGYHTQQVGVLNGNLTVSL